MSVISLRLASDNSELVDLYIQKDQQRTSENAGYDLIIPEKIEIPANARAFRIDHQVCGEMTDQSTYSSLAYYLYPRSSLAIFNKVPTPLRMSNSVGIIDKGYRDNYIACVDNLSDAPYVIEKGTRFFQICDAQLRYFHVEFVSKDSLSNSERGTNGFGSTGR